METAKFIAAFEQTTHADATTRDAGEAFLQSVFKIATFTPKLLEICMAPDVAPPVRQGAVIYLKNTINRYWEDAEEGSDDFSILESDRACIRDFIVEALQSAPDAIRMPLCACVESICRKDYPTKWPSLAPKIMEKLQSEDGASLLAGLLVLHKLVKCYEYRKTSDKQPLFETMKHLLPILYTRMMQLIDNETQEAVFLQKLILKIIFCVVQHSLNLSMISQDDFLRWVDVCRVIVARPVPDATLQVDEDDRPELVWWKVKKWAMYMLVRVFERYGTPGQVGSAYETFAKAYMRTASTGVLEATMNVLDAHRLKVYVSPRVLFRAISYVQIAITHSSTYKIIKPHAQALIRDVVFPLMRHTEEDDELWTDDPKEYIKEKYDIYEEMMCPSSAASQLLVSITKRRTFLPYTLDFIVEVLNSAEATPSDVDAVLHMCGEIAEPIMASKKYGKDVQQLLITQVVPRIKVDGNVRFLRARACWLIAQFSEASYTNKQYLKGTIDLLVSAVVNDAELPVRVEATLAIQMLLMHQPDAEDMLLEHIVPLVQNILTLISETEQDDLTACMDQLINHYSEHIAPIAVQVAQQLSTVFIGFISSEEYSEEKTIAAMGIMGTFETILSVMEDHTEVMVHLEGIVLNVVRKIMEFAHLDYYEEMLSLIDSLTTSRVTEQLWQFLPTLHDMFLEDGLDMFTEMMPVLHNYVTVDTPALLADPTRVLTLIAMAKHVLDAQTEDHMMEAHAAKLLECLILQLPVPNAHLQTILEIALGRLAGKCELSELRVMLIQVCIAGFYTDPVSTMAIMKNAEQQSGSQVDIVKHIVKLWLDDTDCFLGVHDRKLAVLGLCRLLLQHPDALADVAPLVVPNVIALLHALQGAYAEQAAMNADSDDDDDDVDSDGEEGGEKELASDEDDIDADTLDYLESQQAKDSGNETTADLDSDDEDDDWEGETDLEAFTTPIDDADGGIDEFIIFRDTMKHVNETQPEYVASLANSLSAKQREEMNKLFSVAEQRQQAKDSKHSSKTGGYKFNASAPVPTSFNFSPK